MPEIFEIKLFRDCHILGNDFARKKTGYCIPNIVYTIHNTYTNCENQYREQILVLTQQGGNGKGKKD